MCIISSLMISLLLMLGGSSIRMALSSPIVKQMGPSLDFPLRILEVFE